MSSPRILYWDIESAPMLAWVWSQWQDGVTRLESDWYALCVSYRWEGDKRSRVVALDDFDDYDPLAPNDRHVVEACHQLLSEADVAIAHNGDKFDRRKMNARFVYHGLDPVQPYQAVDTLKLARREFMFSSNRLGDLGVHLGLGDKVPTGGFDLWAGCMAGEPKAWSQMKRYAKQDTDLLRDVYMKLRPWDRQHPNMQNFGLEGCTRCGSEHLHSRGTYRTKTMSYPQYQCQSCGGYFHDRSAGSAVSRPAQTH